MWESSNACYKADLNAAVLLHSPRLEFKSPSEICLCHLNTILECIFFIPVIEERPDFRVCQEFRCLCLFPYLKMEQILKKVSSTTFEYIFFFIHMNVREFNEFQRHVVLNLMISKDNFLTWKYIKFLFRTDKRRTSMNGN